MEKIYNFNSLLSFKAVALFFVIFLIFGYQVFTQNIAIQPEGNPLVIIRTQEATFSVKLKNINPVNSVVSLTLDADVPAGFVIKNPLQDGIDNAY